MCQCRRFLSDREIEKWTSVYTLKLEVLRCASGGESGEHQSVTRLVSVHGYTGKLTEVFHMPLY